MAAEETQEGVEEQGLLTLTELADKAGISMPTAAKYKKEHQDRIPTVGEGRTQRYPEKAVEVVREIYQENLSKRGRSGAAASSTKRAGKRRRKSGAKGRRKASKRTRRSKASTATEGMMTLKEVARKAGVSYPTATNYVKKHLDRIPHEGKGRTRRYAEEAVAAVREIYRENLAKRSGGGRKRSEKTSRKSRSRARAAAPSASAGDARLVSVLEKLEKRIAALEKLMAKPLKVEIKR